MPARITLADAAGFERSLKLSSRPSSCRMTKSVNVPPASTPIRTGPFLSRQLSALPVPAPFRFRSAQMDSAKPAVDSVQRNRVGESVQHVLAGAREADLLARAPYQRRPAIAHPLDVAPEDGVAQEDSLFAIGGGG